jgi:hypothetical protein
VLTAQCIGRGAGVRGLSCRFPVMPTQAWSYGQPSDLLGELPLHRHVTLLVLHFIQCGGQRVGERVLGHDVAAFSLDTAALAKSLVECRAWGSTAHMNLGLTTRQWLITLAISALHPPKMALLQDGHVHAFHSFITLPTNLKGQNHLNFVRVCTIATSVPLLRSSCHYMV